MYWNSIIVLKLGTKSTIGKINNSYFCEISRMALYDSVCFQCFQVIRPSVSYWNICISFSVYKAFCQILKEIKRVRQLRIIGNQMKKWKLAFKREYIPVNPGISGSGKYFSMVIFYEKMLVTLILVLNYKSKFIVPNDASFRHTVFSHFPIFLPVLKSSGPQALLLYFQDSFFLLGEPLIIVCFHLDNSQL